MFYGKNIIESIGYIEEEKRKEKKKGKEKEKEKEKEIYDTPSLLSQLIQCLPQEVKPRTRVRFSSETWKIASDCK